MAKAIDEARINEELKEEMAKYDDVGFFRRIGRMFKGLSKPHDTREYKEAVLEVPRLVAPLLAILIPTIGFVILLVVTSMDNGDKQSIRVEVVQAEKDEQLEETPPEEPEEPPPETDVEVQVDTPSIGSPTEITQNVAAPSDEPQSPKPAEMDAMLDIKSPVVMKNVMGTSRNAGVRGKYTSGGANYGDPKTEAAVLKALRWLKKTQNSDGSWNGSCKASSTGFAVLTYLAHGETPSSKEFGATVEAAMNFLITSFYEDKSGVTHIKGCDGNEYAFLIATYALSETFAMTKNPDAREAAEKGLSRIIANQSPTGGWNYKLAKISDSPDDISFGGWAIQAMKAGKMAGIHLSGMEECIKKAIKCLKERNFSKSHGFDYRPGSRGNAGLGGVGCLAMQLLGYGKDAAVANALDVMRTWVPTFDPQDPACQHPKGGWTNPQYYFYYATQCKYQAGMVEGALPANLKSWQVWNQKMKALYPGTIITLPEKIMGPDGKEKEIGYWKNQDAHSSKDFVMATSLCALQLMVYYRYLPTTSLAATKVEEDVEALSKDKTGEISVDDIGL